VRSVMRLGIPLGAAQLLSYPSTTSPFPTLSSCRDPQGTAPIAGNDPAFTLSAIVSLQAMFEAL
jgi:hypothetical protein